MMHGPINIRNAWHVAPPSDGEFCVAVVRHIFYVGVRGKEWVGGSQNECDDEVHDLCCSHNVIDVATQGQAEVVQMYILLFCA